MPASRLALLACLVGGCLLAPPAPGCLNDSEASSAEHQFTSRYTLSADSPRAAWNWIGLGICVVSGGMVAACIVLAVNARADRNVYRSRARR